MKTCLCTLTHHHILYCCTHYFSNLQLPSRAEVYNKACAAVTSSSHALSTLWGTLVTKPVAAAAAAVAVAAIGGAIYGGNAYNKQCKYIASDLSKDLYSGCKWLYKITNQYVLITNKLTGMQYNLGINELTVWQVRV
jgi:hypothetical protein